MMGKGEGVEIYVIKMADVSHDSDKELVLHQIQDEERSKRK